MNLNGFVSMTHTLAFLANKPLTGGAHKMP